MKNTLRNFAKVILIPSLAFFSVPVSVLFSPQNAFAAGDTYTVTTNSNDPGNGDCTDGTVTIFEAVGCANGHVGADTIIIPANSDMGGSITIGGSISVDAGEDLTITGAGSALTTITLGGINIAGAGFSLSGVGLTISGSPQAAISETGAYTGDFSLNDVIINGSAASIGVFISDSDGYDITGNISVASSNISAGRAAVAVGLPGGGSPTAKVHVIGTVNISDNTFTIAPTDGNGFNSAVAFFSADASGAVTVQNNTFVQEGTAEISGFLAMDMNDFGAVFGSTVNISGNTMAVGGTDLLGAGVADLVRSVGLTTISGNSISGGIGQNANIAGGVIMIDGGCVFGGTCVGQTNLLVSNNNINVSYEGSPSFPIILAAAETGTVSGNNVNMNNEDAGGIACTSPTGSVDCTLYNNTVSHVGGIYGILLTPANNGQTASGDIYNNVVWGGSSDAGMGIAAVAMGAGGPMPTGTTINANIYNNSVDGNGHTAGIMAGDMTGDTTLNAVVFNNAVANYNTTNAAGIVQIGTSEAVSFLHDHNMSGPTSTHAFSSTVDGSSYSDLVLGTGDSVNDPEFTNAATGDLSVAYTAPVVDAGAATSNTVNAPATDITGHARYERAANDMGAYEYVNQAPTANAGVDQAVNTGDTVNITCSGTDAETDTITYQWTTVSGPDTPVFPAGAAQSFAASAPGTYVMRCTNSDTYAASSNDSMSVVVTDANTPPVVNAGSDQGNITVGTAVSLLCSSSDADLDTVTYTWSQTAGPSITLTSTNTAASGFTPTAVGTYTLQCAGNDGTVTVNDSVNVVVNAHRLSGADRYATPVAISQQQFSDHSVSAVVIATGTNFPDSLAAGPLASLVGGPILLTQPTSLPSGVSTEIARVLNNSGSNTIYIAGGTSAVSSGVATSLAAIHPGSSSTTVVRLSGSDRYATALAIAQRMDTVRGSGPVKIAIATGAGFADAAAISSPASNSTVAAGRMPILLTSSSALPSAVSSYISSKSGTITKAYIPGGTAVVSDAVKTAVGNIIGAGNVTRLSGSDRYTTAAAIAAEFYGDSNAPTKISIGTGANFPDLLAGGPNAGAANMPILYNNASTVPASISSYVSSHSATLNYIYLYGGTAVVPDAVKTTLQGLI